MYCCVLRCISMTALQTEHYSLGATNRPASNRQKWHRMKTLNVSGDGKRMDGLSDSGCTERIKAKNVSKCLRWWGLILLVKLRRNTAESKPRSRKDRSWFYHLHSKKEGMNHLFQSRSEQWNTSNKAGGGPQVVDPEMIGFYHWTQTTSPVRKPRLNLTYLKTVWIKIKKTWNMKQQLTIQAVDLLTSGSDWRLKCKTLGS